MAEGIAMLVAQLNVGTKHGGLLVAAVAIYTVAAPGSALAARRAASISAWAALIGAAARVALLIDLAMLALT